jgi:hypothetical protein
MIVESFIKNYLPQSSLIVNALSKYKIALVTSIVLIYAQSHFKQSPDTQFSVEKVIKKEIVLDKNKQDKINQEISIVEYAVKHIGDSQEQRTNEVTQNTTKQTVSDTLQLKAPSFVEQVVDSLSETFTPPLPLKTKTLKPVQSLTSSDLSERIMTKELINDKFVLMQDPITNLYFRKVKAGQTLGEVHRALQQDERFAYLKDDSYDPSKSGNVF